MLENMKSVEITEKKSKYRDSLWDSRFDIGCSRWGIRFARNGKSVIWWAYWWRILSETHLERMAEYLWKRQKSERIKHSHQRRRLIIGSGQKEFGFNVHDRRLDRHKRSEEIVESFEILAYLQWLSTVYLHDRASEFETRRIAPMELICRYFE